MVLMATTLRTIFRSNQDDEENDHGDTASCSMTDDDASFDASSLNVVEDNAEDNAEESNILIEESENKCDSELLLKKTMESMVITHLDDDDGDSTFQPKESPQPLGRPTSTSPTISSSNTEPNARRNKVPATEEFRKSSRQRVASLSADTGDFEGYVGPTYLPVSLHFLGDEEVLSPYECLLRKHIEFFGADPLDVRTYNGQSTSIGQVGIRCRNCAHLDCNVRDSMEFPRRYEDLFPSAKRLASHMMHSCDFVSTTLKAELTRLSKLPISFDSNYWAESAKESGVLPGLKWNEWSPRVRAPGSGNRQLHKQYYNYRVGGMSNRKRSFT